MPHLCCQTRQRINPSLSDNHGAELKSSNAVDPEALDNDWSYGWPNLPEEPPAETSVLLASFTLNVLSLGLPIVILQVYDRILPNTALDTLLWLVLGLGIILVLDGFLRISRAHIAGWAAARFEHVAGCRAVDRLLGSQIGSIEQEAPGVHLDRLQAIDQLRDYYAGQGRLLLLDLPFVCLFLGLLWFIGGSLVLVPVAVLLLLGTAAFYLGRQLRETLEERAKIDDRRVSFIIEALGGIHTVKLLAMEALLQRRYEKLHAAGAASTYQATFLSHVAQIIGGLFSQLTMVLVAAVGAVHVMSGDLTVGGLAACTLLAGRTVQPLLRASGLWTQFQSIEIARHRLREIFAAPAEAGEDAIKLDRAQGAIKFEKVSFGYGDVERPLFKDLSLDIAAGEVIGISGHTGCGKSTLLMLMMGVLRPQSGQVRLDGVDMANCDPHRLRRSFALLPQNAVLFQGSILDNLTLFRGPDAVEQSLAAARALGLDELIHRLPAGYDTKVGDGAEDDLPLGVKQGIVIARMLARDPRIILFDEANSAFDRETDVYLKRALEELKGKATIVLISHRASLLALADRRFDLNDGQLVPRGELAGPERKSGRQTPSAEPSDPGAQVAGKVAS